MELPDAGMRKTRPISPPFSRGLCWTLPLLSHLKTPEGCSQLFGNFCRAQWALWGVGRKCVATTLSTSTLEWKGLFYSLVHQHKKPGATVTFPWSGKPNSKASCISREKRRAAFAALEVSYLEIREEPWVLWHIMTWGQPQPPCEGNSVACCAPTTKPIPLELVKLAFTSFWELLRCIAWNPPPLYDTQPASGPLAQTPSIPLHQWGKSCRWKRPCFFHEQLTNGTDTCIGVDFPTP